MDGWEAPLATAWLLCFLLQLCGCPGSATAEVALPLVASLGSLFSHLKRQDFSREQVARGGLLYVFKTAAPEELLPGWTTSVLDLFSFLCFSPSLLSALCIIFLT